MRIKHQPVFIIVGILAVLQLGLLIFFYSKGNNQKAALVPADISMDGILQNGKPYLLKIQKTPFDPKLIQETSIKELIGTKNRQPDYLLASIDLTIEEKQIRFPLKSFRDLANPDITGGIAVAEIGKSAVLIIQGGDKETSYQAKFKIKSGLLLERRLLAGGSELIVTEYPAVYDIQTYSMKPEAEAPTITNVEWKITQHEIPASNQPQTKP